MASSNFFNPKSTQTNLKKGVVQFNDPGDRKILGPFPSPSPSAMPVPTVITDGLIIWLDGSSYTSGNWNSLVGNYVGVLTNTQGTISKQYNNAGVVQSTGLVEGEGFEIAGNFQNSEYTVMTATRYMPGGVNGYQGRIVSAVTNNWLLGNYEGSINQYYAEGWVYDPYEPDNTDWNIYTGTRNNFGVYTLYNGITRLTINLNGTEGPINLGIFKHQYANEVSYGQCGFLLVYNRVLTDAEIEYNYNAYKSRYGLS